MKKMSINLMDPLFNEMGGSEFYRSLVFPDLFPHEKPMLIGNWSEQDREMFCGVTKGNCID
jgi:hypothetical protein